MKKISFSICCLFLACFGCTKIDGTLSEHTTPVKIDDYLYEITYNDYEPLATQRYANTIKNVSQGAACSVIRNGDYVGRNFDYLYSEMAEFIIHVPASEGRYASIGVAAAVFELTKKNAEEDSNGQYFDLLPYFTMDGINEKGLFCAINMVYGDESSATTGTRPDVAETLYFSMTVRYVLDKCATVEEACRALENKNLAFLSLIGECHFILADRTETRVIEIFDNKMVCKRPKDEIMTNFYVLSDSFLEEDTPGRLANGTERYDYALQHLDKFTSVEGAAGVMKGLRYSQLYDLNHSPFWYSDYYGCVYNGLEIDAYTPRELYADYIREDSEGFADKKRDYIQQWWITTHTSVYDLEKLSLRVYAQERYDKPFDFNLK